MSMLNIFKSSPEPIQPVGRVVSTQRKPISSRSNSISHSSVLTAPIDENVAVDLKAVAIVSAAGELAANQEQIRLLCFLSDGRLLIPKGQEHNTHVMSYITLLQRRNVPHRIIRTPQRAITQIYSEAGVAITDDSNRQNHTAMLSEATKFIAEAAKSSASDIHIRIDRTSTEILYRIHGDLERKHDRPVDFGERLLRAMYHGMADMSEDTFKKSERLDARIADPSKLPPGLDGVRIATSPTAEGSLMVLRMLYKDDSDNLDPCELGFSSDHRYLFEHMQEQPIGLNIISGPTGSGKSTTLQRLLRLYIANTEGRKHVLTIEDPTEYPIPGSIQTPIGTFKTAKEREEAFINAIMSAMRLDPDTLMIGELRDLPSAELALRAATTGHQVWTTLHANNALGIVDRLVNLGISPDMLLDHTVLTGLISQRLVKKMCPHCKVPLRENANTIPPRALDRIQSALGEHWVDVFLTGPGCDHCNSKGSIGRTTVAEIVIPDPVLCELLRKGERVKARQHWLMDQNGKSIIHHAIEKVQAGVVDPIMAERIVGPLNMAEMLMDNIVTVREVVGGR